MRSKRPARLNSGGSFEMSLLVAMKKTSDPDSARSDNQVNSVPSTRAPTPESPSPLDPDNAFSTSDYVTHQPLPLMLLQLPVSPDYVIHLFCCRSNFALQVEQRPRAPCFRSVRPQSIQQSCLRDQRPAFFAIRALLRSSRCSSA